MSSWRGVRVFTFGHSTRGFEEIVEILGAHGVEIVADIRTVPKSRRHPHVAKDSLERAMPAVGILYAHIAELGGLRKTRADSPNAAWRNESFRGYADHMGSESFARGLDELATLAMSAPTTVMCAEAVPWRCHRQLVADALVARGAEVRHIMSATQASPHRLTGFARVDGERVTYPSLL